MKIEETYSGGGDNGRCLIDEAKPGIRGGTQSNMIQLQSIIFGWDRKASIQLTAGGLPLSRA